jgi:hypothetical protein
VEIFRALCTFARLAVDFSLIIGAVAFLLAFFSSSLLSSVVFFFFFFSIGISRSSLDAGSSFFFFLATGISRSSLDSGSSFFFFLAFSISLATLSFSLSSLMELPPSPPCEVETAACFLFLTRGTSSSSSSS